MTKHILLIIKDCHGLLHKPRNDKRISAGFTLIELLVVILIISIIITAALFSMSRFMQNRQLDNTAKALAFIIPVAQQQAMLQPAILGLNISPHQYTFYRFIINPHTNTGNWQLIKQDRILHAQRLTADIKLTFITHTSDLLTPTDKTATPQIIFFPSGDMTPFTINISVDDKSAAYAISGKANGDVSLNELNK